MSKSTPTIRSEAEARQYIHENTEANGKLREKAKMLQRLLDARGERVPLPEILSLNISQYGRCIKQLRAMIAGYGIIENGGESVNGKRHTWFRLSFSPRAPQLSPLRSAPIAKQPEVRPPSPIGSGFLFPVSSVDRSYVE